MVSDNVIPFPTPAEDREVIRIGWRTFERVSDTLWRLVEDRTPSA